VTLLFVYVGKGHRSSYKSQFGHLELGVFHYKFRFSMRDVHVCEASDTSNTDPRLGSLLKVSSTPQCISIFSKMCTHGRRSLYISHSDYLLMVRMESLLSIGITDQM
jgi:hypothetical protein